MDSIKDKLVQIFLKQGITVILLLLAIWYIKTDNDELRAQLFKNQEKIESYYKNDNVQMLKAIERGNEVIARNNQIFESYLKLK
jgi:hypothetical protein